MNEPISFEPIAMERVWGGNSLARFGKKLPPGAPIGEIWEMVDRKDAQSVVTSGELEGKTLNDLWRHQREEVFGSAYITHRSERFPILVKLLDASDKLSVQVHPPAHKAQELGGEPKTEVWYFLDCTGDANIYAGLKKGITREVFQKLLETGGMETALHEIPVRAGESIFIPSGRLHAIGAGNVIIEIQQNSDTTYRVFDWNRVGLDGQPRALHVQESLESIDFTDFEPGVQTIEADGTLVKCEFFDVRLRREAGAVGTTGECVTLAVVGGAIRVGGVTLNAGDFALLPASMDAKSREVTPVDATTQWLEIRIPA